MSDNEHYSVDIICKNCGCCQSIYVLRGRSTVEQVRLEAIPCTNCMLRIKEFDVRHKIISGKRIYYI